MGTCVSVRFRNEQFFLWARPHKGFDRRRSMATLRIKTRGERRPEEKEPFMDGHYLTLSMACPQFMEILRYI
jgi:hypothetical protein